MRFWRKLLGATPPPADAAARRRLATAVLLLETARADFDHAPDELAAVRTELQRSLGLEPAALDELIGAARDHAAATVSLHDLIATLNASLDADARRELLAMLWRVAWADGRIDAHEEHLIRRLADLLYVPHSAFIREKHRAAPP